MQDKEVDLVQLCLSYKTELLSGFSFAFFLFLIVAVGGVLASGVLLGMISSLGFAMLVMESRSSAPWLYNLMIRNPFWTDVVSTVLVAGIFGVSVNGLVGSAVFGVLNGIIILLLNKYTYTELQPQSLFETFKEKIQQRISSPLEQPLKAV